MYAIRSYYAENKVMILFNASNDRVDAIEKYLSDNELFADEPTKNVGKYFTEFSIQVDKSDKKQSLARVRYELAKLGAANIDTIPVDSSIHNMEVLNLWSTGDQLTARGTSKVQ